MLDNPYEKDGKWWWYDETQLDYGPYDTEEEALLVLKEYCEKYL